MFIRELGVFPLLLTLELTTHTKCRLKLISSLVKTKIREKKQSYVVRHNRVTIDRSSYSCSCTGHGTEVKGNIVIHSCSRKFSDNLKQSLAPETEENHHFNGKLLDQHRKFFKQIGTNLEKDRKSLPISSFNSVV